MRFNTYVGLLVLAGCSLDVRGLAPGGGSLTSPTRPRSTADEGPDAGALVDAASAAAVNDDLCPADPNKVAPGVCGCGIPEDGCGEPVRCARTGEERACEPAAAPGGVGDNEEDCVEDCPGVGEDAGVDCEADGTCPNAPPTLAFIEPSSFAVARGKLGVLADAADSDGSIVRVTLYVDEKRIRDEREKPYEWGSNARRTELANLDPGKHYLELEAEDDSGAKTRVGKEVFIAAD
jgi:hypothetical protein